jgi:hypothetical protein
MLREWVRGGRTREVTLDPGASTDTPVRIQGQAGACPDRTRAIPCTVRAARNAAAEYSNEPHSNEHEPSPTPSVSWDSDQPRSTAASSGPRDLDPWARRRDVRSTCDSKRPTTVTYG